MSLLEKKLILSEKWAKTFDQDEPTPIQGSPEWLLQRTGVVTASECSKAVAKAESQTFQSYVMKKVAECATGQTPDIGNVSAMAWGKHHEAASQAAYEFATGRDFQIAPLCFKNNRFRQGASVDGIAGDRLVEIKCPYNSEHYINFFLNDKIKPEYQWQVQFQMWVMDAEICDFVQYDSRMIKNPIKIVEVPRDPKKIEKIEEAMKRIDDQVDEALLKIGLRFGDHWFQRKESFSA